MYKFVAGFALMVVIFGGCKSDLNKTGYDLLLPGDLVSPRKAIIDKTKNKAFTVTDEIQRTDEPAYNLLGTFNDPVFGKTTTDFACQFRLDEYRDFKNATPDSIVLNFVYMEKFGDVTTPQKLRVYELASDLYASPYKYYQKEDLKSRAKSEVLAELNYIPKFELYYDPTKTTIGSTKETPKDTVIQDIKFRLNLSLAQKLMAADSLSRSDNDKFINYFKGLYVEAGDLNQGGTVMKVKTLALGSVMKLYFHKDTVKDSISYKINSSAARVSHFVHNYSTTVFATNLDSLDQQDDKIYLQTTGGLASKLFIPELNNWRDSVGCAINKAELIFTVDQAVSDTAKFKPPYQLILSAIGKKVNTQVDSLYFPSDLGFSQAYYGGIYNEKDGTYRFNLAKHMQEFITKSTKKKDISGYLKDNYAFYLSMANRNSSFSRVVLKGATSDVGIRMEITYSKYK